MRSLLPFSIGGSTRPSCQLSIGVRGFLRLPTYYINLFTAETWREIRENAEFAYSGQRQGARNRDRVKPGDVLLCYVTRVSAFVGALEVTSDVYEIDHEDEPTWASDLYP